MTADVATADEADLLGVPPATAVLRQTRRALAGDAVVEVSRSCYRPTSTRCAFSSVRRPDR